MAENEPSPKRWLIVPLWDMLAVCAVLSFLYAFLLPAVNMARESHGEPLVHTFFVPFYSGDPWPFILIFPLVTTTILAGVMLALRAVLPQSMRERFPWTAPPKPKVEPKPTPSVQPELSPESFCDPRSAVISAITAVSATAILIFAASHVRADRTHRRPVITMEGPLADYVLYLAMLGWILSLLATVIAGHKLAKMPLFGGTPYERYVSRWNGAAAIAVVLGILNIVASCMFWMAATED